MEKSVELVKVLFTETELLEMGAELARVCAAIGELEEQKKASAKEFKDLIDGKVEVREALVKNLRSGAHEIEMECTVVRDYEAGEVIFYHTGEEVKRRPMTGDEREQPGLFQGAEDAGGEMEAPPEYPPEDIVDQNYKGSDEPVFCERCGEQIDGGECEHCGNLIG